MINLDFMKKRQQQREEEYKKQKQEQPNEQKVVKPQTRWSRQAIKAFRNWNEKNTKTGVFFVSSPKTHNFGWWYSYFAKSVLWQDYNRVSDEKIDELIIEIFGLPRRSDPNAQVQAIEIKTPESFSDQKRLKILTLVMSFGFVSYNNMGNSLHHNFPIIRPINTLNTQEEKWNKLTTNWNDIRNLFPIFYDVDNHILAVACRGEKRKPSQVIDHRGTKAKVLVGLDNTNKEWNPFNQSQSAHNEMFFRIAQADNCLYSAVSIAGLPEVAINFPLIDEGAIYTYPPKPVNEWTIEERKAAADSGISIAKVQFSSSQPAKYLMGTETYIYLCRLVDNDQFANTQQAAQIFKTPPDFPERAVREIPLNKLMAAIKVRRIHLGHGELARQDGLIGVTVETSYFYGDKFNPSKSIEIEEFAQQHFFGKQKQAQLFIKYVKEKTNDLILGDVPNKQVYPQELKEFKLLDWIDPKDFNPQNLASEQSLSNSSSMLSSSHEPILINGEKVIFDKAVPTTPVALEPKPTHRQAYTNGNGYRPY